MNLMSNYRLPVCSSAEMRKIDELASKEFHVDPLLLMEDAGTAIYSLLAYEVGLNKRYVVIAGTGNNGGDALVVARRLYSCGCGVRVFIIGDPSKYPEPARRNYELLNVIGVPTRVIMSASELNTLIDALINCDVVVVGLIGIGLRGEVGGLYREVIELVNNARKVVVSVDIPSGINADNGQVCGAAIKSTYTVTFGAPKYGNILYPGYYYCGKLYVSRLSYPPELYDLVGVKVELNTPITMPERIKWGHKGTFGKFLAIAGARYYYGAPYYVAYSFLKAGGGYSRLAAPKSIVPYVASRCSEVVYMPLEETPEGSISKANYDYIIKAIDLYDIDIVALGPGTSLNAETQELILELAKAIKKPLIIDGDGLTAISKEVDVIRGREAPTILTPHLIEFQRITNLDLKEIINDPIGVLRKVCTDLNAYIVLKGAHSLIGYPNGTIYVNMTGNPGMAKAGSGDVLTGTIAAMYGIGYRDIGSAVRMGALVHGLAGDLAAEDLGEDGLTPDDIMNYLPNAMKLLRNNAEYVISKYMPKII